MDLQQLIELDQQLLLLFHGSGSVFIDQLALALTAGITWLPLYVMLFVLVLKNNEKPSQIVLIVLSALLCVGIAYGISGGLVKPYVHRLRPVMEPSLTGLVAPVDGYVPSGYSFFSSHAANTFSLTVFFALLVRHRAFTVAMILWSLVNCWTRLYLGAHYPFDILTGLVCGALVGIGVYLLYFRIYSRITPKLHYISTQYTKTGYSLIDIDLVLTMLVLTGIYCAVWATVHAF